MVALAVHTLHDDVLGVVVPFALASFQRTVLVIDLDLDGIPLPGNRTLAHLVEEEPTLAELVPPRSGVAVLPHGGIDVASAAPVVAALVDSWPCVVVRARKPLPGIPFAEVAPLIPGVNTKASPRVWVRTGIARVEPGPGPVVDGPGRTAIASVVARRAPAGRWLRSWAGVWRWPWP